ncbi:MAG TPA: hypothetical protein VGV89_10670, partial [Thermoplasmata archaeon]|nr:hypothetical protein [Thermoplasmata archaeon]
LNQCLERHLSLTVRASVVFLPPDSVSAIDGGAAHRGPLLKNAGAGVRDGGLGRRAGAGSPVERRGIFSVQGGG